METLRRCIEKKFVKNVASVAQGFPDVNSDTSFKLLVATLQHIINWLKERFDYFVQDRKMVKKSFQVGGISSSYPDKVRNGAIFKQRMEKALHNLEADDASEIDDDPFEFYDYYTIMKSVINYYDYA